VPHAFQPAGGGSSSAPGGTITTDTTGTPLVSISFTQAPAAAASADTLTFASQTVGTIGAAQSVTVTNGGPGLMQIARPRSTAPPPPTTS
jgi:hypothetical protein